MSFRRRNSQRQQQQLATAAVAVGLDQLSVGNLLYCRGEQRPTAAAAATPPPPPAIPHPSPVPSHIFPIATATPPPQSRAILSPPPLLFLRVIVADLWLHRPHPPRTCRQRLHRCQVRGKRRPKMSPILWMTDEECRRVFRLPKCLSQRNPIVAGLAAAAVVAAVPVVRRQRYRCLRNTREKRRQNLNLLEIPWQPCRAVLFRRPPMEQALGKVPLISRPMCRWSPSW